MGFFKNGDELFQLGEDLIGRKDFSEAREKFQKALDKGCKDEAKARFYISMIYLSEALGEPGRYEHLKEALYKLPEGGVKFGVTTVDRELLIAQCEISVMEISASRMDDRDWMEKGQALLQAAAEFAGRIGDSNLPIQEMLRGTALSGTRESLILQAQAYEVMGKGAVYGNPKQGSEYLQMAYNFRRQIGDSGEEDLRLMKQFSITARCWLCGKQVAGQGVHFMAVPSEISDMFRGKESNEAIRSTDENFHDIYMCMPCYTAISNRSDEISRRYYDMAMSEMRAMEARIMAEMAALRMANISMRR